VEHEQLLRQFTVHSARDIGIRLGETQIDKFMSYLHELQKWNKTINLTAITDPREIIIKHFIDSIAALVATVFPQGAVILDVGAGAGFPGIPLKIVRDDLKLVLVEPSQKKCSFLRFITGLLQLDRTTTYEATIRQYAASPARPAADIVMVRALKFADIASYFPSILAKDGKVVLYRTEPINQQENKGTMRIQAESSLALPEGYGQRVITVLSNA
jgi:16S rRNA (guanine527-N7)-methyltransferase